VSGKEARKGVPEPIVVKGTKYYAVPSPETCTTCAFRGKYPCTNEVEEENRKAIGKKGCYNVRQVHDLSGITWQPESPEVVARHVAWRISK
jgi:hypothetical protein